MLKSSLLFLCIALFSMLSTSGCSRQEMCDSTTDMQTAPQRFRAGNSQSTLSKEEITAFLHVVKRLPGESVPEFVATPLPRLTSLQRLDVEMARLREAIRNAVTPERQLEGWEQDANLSKAFSNIRVNPVAFANLTLRISCAWSAWSVCQDTSLQEAREQVEFRTMQLVRELKQQPVETSATAHQPLLEALEELIAISEFLNLLERVPNESLNMIAESEADLRRVMPKTNMAREFARHIQTQAAILRVGHPAR